MFPEPDSSHAIKLIRRILRAELHRVGASPPLDGATPCRPTGAALLGKGAERQRLADVSLRT
jgi:hypothetical protein